MYIRQLALHLRTAIAKQTSEATRQVTTWQFMHCIRLWTRVVCSMPRDDQLGPLVFPLTQGMYVLSSPVLSCPLLSCPVLSCPVLSTPIFCMNDVFFFFSHSPLFLLVFL